MEKIIYNYSKLKGRVTECFDTQENFANAMGMSRVSISQKLNNISYFSQYEIDKACELLSIDPTEIPTYFFTHKVQITQEIKRG